MLLINKKILEDISAAFCTCEVEKGFLLGSSADLTYIDHCFDLPARDAGLHFYEPDPVLADKQIQHWANQGVCFCGMIHSHVVDKQELSENDIEYAKVLFSAYHLPLLWFGIGIVHANKVDFRIYSVSESDGQVNINQEEYKIET